MRKKSGVFNMLRKLSQALQITLSNITISNITITLFIHFQGKGSNVEIRLCPCNKVNRRQTMRNKRTQGNKSNSQLLQNYIPQILPFMDESKITHNKSRNHIMPNKTTNNVTFENGEKDSSNVGKYYYKIF